MKHIFVALLCLGSAWSTHASIRPVGAERMPPMPAELEGYFAAALKAEQLADPVERCLAYPDLPGNQWPEGAAAAYCRMIVRPKALTLDELEQLLDRPDAATAIDARLSALLEAHYQDPAQRDRIHEFFFQFDRSERSGGIAARWLRAAPRSPYAQTALGHHRVKLGWEARGGAYGHETSAQQIKRMRQHFLAAMPLLNEALASEPRLAAACVELAGMGRMLSDDIQWPALAHCEQVDPLSYWVVRELLVSATPRWSGSLAAIDAVAGYARERAALNPTLHALVADAQSERLEARKSEDPAAHFAAARIAAHASVLEEARFKAEGWQRVVYLTQLLRFAPEDKDARGGRYHYMWRADLDDWVLLDLEWLARNVPDKRGYGHAYGMQMNARGRHAEGVPYLRASMALPDAYPDTWLVLCEALAADPDLIGSDEVGQCSARALAEFPEDFAPWFWRAQHLTARQDREGLTGLLASLRAAGRRAPDPRWAILIGNIEGVLGWQR